ncbi:hypothetical protein THAOC_22335, partial [Thalassiosira oceanica]
MIRVRRRAATPPPPSQPLRRATKRWAKVAAAATPRIPTASILGPEGAGDWAGRLPAPLRTGPRRSQRPRRLPSQRRVVQDRVVVGPQSCVLDLAATSPQPTSSSPDCEATRYTSPLLFQGARGMGRRKPRGGKAPGTRERTRGRSTSRPRCTSSTESTLLVQKIKILKMEEDGAP